MVLALSPAEIPVVTSFMATHGRGLICIPMTEERLAKLELSRMVSSGGDHHGTAFTVSVDAKKDVTTGISAGDRARTIAALIDERTNSHRHFCFRQDDQPSGRCNECLFQQTG